jgi:Domain of unknown function (DUF4136)
MRPPMYRAAHAAIVLASLWMAGCATTMTLSSHLDPGEDLRRYRTYTWGPADTWSTGDPRLDNNRFFDERVRAQVEKGLGGRGFEKTTSPSADMLVHYHANISQEVDIRDLDSAYCAEADCRPFIYDKGTLFVDLVEPGTKRLIWRGWAEGSLDGVIENQKWMEKRIDETIEKILTRLPRL